MALPPTPTKIPLDEAVGRYLEACQCKALVRRLSPATVGNSTGDLYRFLELLPQAGQHTTESVTGVHIDEVLLAYANTADHRRTPAPGEMVQDPRRRMAATDQGAKAPGSTLRMRRSLSGFFAYCVDQAKALLTHGPGDAAPNPHHDRDAIAMGLTGVLGLRAGEIVALDADRFTRSTTTISASIQIHGKGRTWRTVPLPPWLEELVVAYRTRPGTDAATALLLSPTGRRLAVRDIERPLERAVKRTRTADPTHARAVVPHGLRHTAATLMLAEGGDVKVVAQLLGHSSVNTTSKYLDELPGEFSVAVNAHPPHPKVRAITSCPLTASQLERI